MPISITVNSDAALATVDDYIVSLNQAIANGSIAWQDAAGDVALAHLIAASQNDAFAGNINRDYESFIQNAPLNGAAYQSSSGITAQAEADVAAQIDAQVAADDIAAGVPPVTTVISNSPYSIPTSPDDTSTPTNTVSSSGSSTIVNPPAVVSSSGGSSSAGGSTQPSVTTTPSNTISSVTNSPSPSLSGASSTTGTEISSAASGNGLLPFDFSGIEGFFTTFIPSIGSGIANWLEQNIILPLKAFFLWLLNLILSIFGLSYSSQSGITYSAQITGLTIPSTLAETEAYEGFVTKLIDKPSNIFEFVIALFIRYELALAAMGARLLPLLKVLTQVANSQQPTELIAVPDLIAGVYQGNVTQQQATTISGYAGVSPDDFKTLFNNASYVPTTQEASLWLARGYINNAQYQSYASAARSTQTIANLQQASSIAPYSVQSFLQYLPRAAAAQSGFLSQSLSSAPPASLVNAYNYSQLDPNQATADWINHFEIPPPEWFVRASFRGLVDQNAVQGAAIAAGYPPEIAGLFVTMNQSLIPTRTIGTLLAQNIISEQQATQYYLKAGFSITDVPVLIAYAATLVKKPPKGAPADLARLALSDAIALFNDGAIPASELVTIYEAHGWTADAAALAIEYLGLKSATASRKAFANEIVDDVSLGTMTIAAAVQTLHANGYTTQEVLTYQRKMGKAAKVKVTVPTVAQITSMYSSGYIAQTDVENYFNSQGYADPYKQGLIDTVLASQVTGSNVVSPPDAATS